MNQPYGMHWFRRDLRVAGNAALRKNFAQFSGRVLGIFCFDPVFLSRDDFSFDRFGFFLNTLESLREELRTMGGDLLVLDGGPDEAMSRLFSLLKENRSSLPSLISFNRDYEPFARSRDLRMSRWFCETCGIQVQTERDHLLIEPDEIKKEEGGSYQVYGAFARKWFELFAGSTIQNRIQEQIKGLADLEKRSKAKAGENSLFVLLWKDLLGEKIKNLDALDRFRNEIQKKLRVPIPHAGAIEALKRLDAFSLRIDDYSKRRDIPSDEEGTSHLSVFLKNGSLTVSQMIARLGLQNCRYKQGTGKSVFLQELVWREFYYSILYHNPTVENQSFLPQYRNLNWENRVDFFEAWKAGKTGFPIVDAAMRELDSTGWMHNRARMIVASFLTKDLLIDWRWGEKYFMNRLLDGDLAPNNGGWQWAASTGCDPQPYFRIFNPVLQSKKFDPEGRYIRRFIPELKSVSHREIHAPSEQTAKQCGYPVPLVQHASRRLLALQLYSGKR